MYVEHRTALHWRPGRRAHWRPLAGAREAPRAFGPSSVGLDDLVAGGARAERRVRPRLYTLENAYLVVGEGEDGVVLTEARELVSEFTTFAQVGGRPTPLELDKPLQPEVLEEAIAGVDGAWWNYYHWLVNGLARSRLAADAAPAGATILLPDFHKSRHADWQVRTAVLQSSADWVLDGRPYRLLPPGIHPVRRLHAFWTRPHGSTDIAGVGDFYRVFDDVARRLAGPPAPGRRRLFLSRKGSESQRLPAADRDRLRSLLTVHGFEALDLAAMSFESQVRAAAAAEVIVAPHGAGMANLLFSPRQAMVIELTSRMDHKREYRPWYFQLCDGRGQPYAALDTDHPDWLADLAAAIEAATRRSRQG